MLHCPKCGTEYEEGALECMDCHVALLPGPPVSLVERKRPEFRRDVKLVPVHVFSGGTALIEAQLARSWLESEGIASVLPGEPSVGMLPVLDVPVLVCEEDAEEARRIIKGYLESNAAQRASEGEI